MTDKNETQMPPDEDRDQCGLCEEAQADGVPCYELGRKCETCERGRAPLPPPPARPPRTSG